MSRGPGEVQRVILTLLADGPRPVSELRARVGGRDLARQLVGLQRMGRVLVSAGNAALSRPDESPVSAECAALIHGDRTARVYHADWKALLTEVPQCDALVCDPPYSATTHNGHDKASWITGAGRDGNMRRALAFGAWTPTDVGAFVRAWAPRCRGWFAALTDHSLAPAWRGALEAAGRYVFAPVPCVVMGGRVRLGGDGPSSITNWAIVARPRRKPYSNWGTLTGAYSVPRERLHLVGDKPLALMRQIVGDYTRAGDLVCDPTCGAGTTLRAAIELGRRAVGGDALAAHAHFAAAWLAEPVQQLISVAPAPEQLQFGAVVARVRP